MQYGTWWHRLEEASSSSSSTAELDIVKYGRRSHSSVMYWNGTREFMILTGGINDNDNSDWNDDFPIWSLDITCSSEYTNQLQSLNDHPHSATTMNNNTCSYPPHSSSSSFWKELTPKHKPSARIGHVSFLSNHSLYVFGGLLPSNTINFDEDMVHPYGYDMDDPTRRRNELLITEEQLVLYKYNLTHPKNSVEEDTSWESIPLTMTNTYYHNHFKSRGECQGGFWKEKNAMIIYGGLHKNTATTHQLLGDVWMIHLDTFTIEQVFDFPTFQTSYDPNDYPLPRTAHASTIIGDELVIHGGMTKTKPTTGGQVKEQWYVLHDVWLFNLQTRMWRKKMMFPNIARSYHSMVSSSNKFIIFGGFRTSLLTLQNYQPSIAYVFADTFVGTISNEDKQTYTTTTITTTNDTTTSNSISEIMNGQWLEAYHPMKQKFHNTMSTSISAQNDDHHHTIHSRLEHTAVIDRFGTMHVWGGRFRETLHNDGVWSLDVMNSVLFKPATMDELDLLESELQSLHILIVSLFIFCMIMFLFYSVLNPNQRNHINPFLAQRRHRRSDAHRHHGQTITSSSSSSRQNGLSQTIVDSLPLVKYKDIQEETPKECAVVDSCAICLIDYEIEKDDDIRMLPCKHYFHKHCVDKWLQSHVSCPTCRFHIVNNDNTSNNNTVLSSSSIQDQQQETNENPNNYSHNNQQETSTDASSRPFRWNSRRFVSQLLGISSYVTIHNNVDDEEMVHHSTELTAVDAELT